MSEFQYFEFRAVDRPLTDAEMRKLRTYSSRAIITPVGFANNYDWGDFKGDEDAWMEKYFDVFLYFANWGTHVLMFRLPSELLPLELARTYCPRESARAWEKAGKVILAFVSEDEEGDYWDEVGTKLDSFVPVRDEIARGDLRALYIAWLLCVQNFEIEKGEKEPPVPPNLARLSAPQRKMAEFLRIDEHVLAAAAQASQKIADEPCTESELLNWLGALSTGEKDKMLVDAMRGKKCRVGDALMARFVRERRRIPSGPAGAKRRTVAELLHIADELRQARAHQTRS